MYVFKTKLFTHARFRNAQALFLAKWTYTNKKQRRFIRNFFNIRLTNKHMRVDETYVILGQNLHFSLLKGTSEFTISCSMYGFWFLKKYNYCVHELILIFKSKITNCSLKKWICWQSIFLYLTVTHIWMQKNFIELNQLIFR